MNIDTFVTSIDSSDISDAFECLGSFFILRGEVLAVPAPRGIELNQPYSLLDLVKIIGFELGDC